MQIENAPCSLESLKKRKLTYLFVDEMVVRIKKT